MVGEELVLAEVSMEDGQVGDIIVDNEVEEEVECEECPPERGPDYYLFVAGLGIGLVVGYLVGKKS